VKNRFDRIQDLNVKFHFCEDCTASLPVDLDQQSFSGPLEGRVIGFKSNIQVAKQAWTAGIRARAGVISQTDAPLVARLRLAGALILSRLAMDEGALGASTDNPHFGRCENPTFPGNSAGGSSGGSAAAVAAEAVDAAFGSDTMGSVRIPAAYCGVYGLKFGAGSMDLAGIFPLAPSLDSLGLFAKTPQILRSVLDSSCEARTALPTIDRWMACDPEALSGCHPDVISFYESTYAALSGLMGPPSSLGPVDFSGLRNDAFLLTEAEAVTSLGGEEGLSPNLRKLIDYGRKLGSEKLVPVRGRLTSARNTLIAGLGGTRTVLLPCVAQPSFAHGRAAPKGQADFTALANIAGLPAISIPKPGAQPPVAVQLVGPKGSEHALIDLAQRLAEVP
jgi:aspartyl-tRNA(Asn)/glutamyl-tRNA(Gln) amidotransferase subunit A